MNIDELIYKHIHTNDWKDTHQSVNIISGLRDYC